ncbi:MAG: hypothetical protein HYR55_16430 [Acidobacteria bacterium]|nr:hypothetical protein [Acidobacteriota bacterium]MBI3658125.1 hypothetical protein [Acidobacteriota bacterium]
MQPSLKENSRTLDALVDYLLDDFVDRSEKLSRRLTQETEALVALVPRYREGSAEPGKRDVDGDRRLLEETRSRAEALKKVAKDLEGQMDFLIQVLRLVIKGNATTPPTPAPYQIQEDIESLRKFVAIFRKDLDEFFHPKSNSVSLETLQSAALPVQLKKIERYAERIETTSKRLR